MHMLAKFIFVPIILEVGDIISYKVKQIKTDTF